MGGLCQRLSVGLDKLITTGEEVAVMQKSLLHSSQCSRRHKEVAI